jgi:hypothetical protein
MRGNYNTLHNEPALCGTKRLSGAMDSNQRYQHRLRALEHFTLSAYYCRSSSRNVTVAAHHADHRTSRRQANLHFQVTCQALAQQQRCCIAETLCSAGTPTRTWCISEGIFHVS